MVGIFVAPIDVPLCIRFPTYFRDAHPRSGVSSFFYGNFNADRTEWETFPATARFGTTYVGLRNRLSILSEAYNYDPYQTRVLATLAFVRQVLETSAAHRAEIVALLDAAKHDAVHAGRNPAPGDRVAVQSRADLAAEPAVISGYSERAERDHQFNADEYKEYPVRLRTNFTAAESVLRPFAYLVPPRFGAAVAVLKRHGLEVEALREDVELNVEIHRVESIERAAALYQGRRPVNLAVSTPIEARRKIAAGTLVVPTAQPLGSLAVYLLEPRSEDGLTVWNFFDDGLKPGADFPVLRLPRPTILRLGPLPAPQ